MRLDEMSLFFLKNETLPTCWLTSRLDAGGRGRAGGLVGWSSASTLGGCGWGVGRGRGYPRVKKRLEMIRFQFSRDLVRAIRAGAGAGARVVLGRYVDGCRARRRAGQGRASFGP